MKYLVTMEMMEPVLPAILASPQQTVQHIEQVLKQHEALTKLEAEKKILAVGGPVGKRADVFVVDVASEEELNELLMGLPNFAKMNVDVTPLLDFKVADAKIRQNLERLKAALK
jgi:muconolactone delta-isomerase